MPKSTWNLKRIERYALFVLAAVLVCSFISDWQSRRQRPWKVRAYVDKYLYLAIELEQDAKIPVPVTLAVAGLESDWGRSDLAKKANNHFGLKVKPGWEGWEYCKDTQEYSLGKGHHQEWACFRKYPLIKRSYQDFGRFLLKEERYWRLRTLELNDYPGWAEGLQQAGYATDPAYAQKLRGLIWKYRLSEFQP